MEVNLIPMRQFLHVQPAILLADLEIAELISEYVFVQITLMAFLPKSLTKGISSTTTR